ncbi:MAG: FkbM family methyltransferase [Anaerolineae bacterium]|nr:FkbM family methyltransferase [Anaerolineae bacterium]
MTIVQRGFRKVSRELKKTYRRQLARKSGVICVPPNYLYLDRFTQASVVLDAGCGFEADLSVHLINKYGLHAYGIDPTRKHAPALKLLAGQLEGRFTHVPVAVAGRDGTLVFHESEEHESGSLFDDHTNIRRDHTRSYEVEGCTLTTLLGRLGLQRADYLKLDLEGAEYALISQARREDFTPFAQIFIEFHHHAIGHYTEKDTAAMVARMQDFGFQAFSLEDHNFLFFN